MAAVFTSLTSGSDATNASTYETASVSPSARHVLLLAVGIHDVGVATPTITGLDLTWNAVEAISNGVEWRMAVFWADSGNSPGSGTLTIDFSGNSMQNCAWSLVQVDNVSRTSPIVQDSEADSGADASLLTVTLNAFAKAGNATYGAMMMLATVALDTVTHGTGFTELHEINVEDTAGDGQITHTQFRADADTSVTWTFDTKTAIGVAAELNVTGTSGGGAGGGGGGGGGQGGGGGGGGGKGPPGGGGPPGQGGGGPPGQQRRAIVGTRRPRRRGLVQLF